jgi:hypothetical protein
MGSIVQQTSLCTSLEGVYKLQLGLCPVAVLRKKINNTPEKTVIQNGNSNT